MNEEIHIILYPLNKELKVKNGTPLIDVLHEFGVEFPCGGKGNCGACKVRLLKGELHKSAAEEQKLKKLKLGKDWRLACYCTANSDITLEVSQFEHIILADQSDFGFNPREGAGIAVDLGTTTIVAQLVDLKTGTVLDSVSDVNPQLRYGADLISRIQSCLEGNQAGMQQLIRGKIGDMIAMMLRKHPVDVLKVEIVGNTVMHHIFCGLDVQPLSMYPFHTPNRESRTFTAEQLGWELPLRTKIQFQASIGSFVGSDILAGIAATKMAGQPEYSILIDLGTNGEIAMGNNKRIVCASTAAGPAFEGAKIKQGMRATTGAISSVQPTDHHFDIHVIGNVEAKGICGSGLVDILAVLLDKQQIGMFGEIGSGADSVPLTQQVSLTQQDIREFQLAKAALATGIQILLNQLKITMNDIDKIYIAGGFGHFLNIRNVIRTGLIEAEEEKIQKLGNTALIGAKMFLFEEDAAIQNILNLTSHVNLEGEPSFQDIYIEKMLLI